MASLREKRVTLTSPALTTAALLIDTVYFLSASRQLVADKPPYLLGTQRYIYLYSRHIKRFCLCCFSLNLLFFRKHNFSICWWSKIRSGWDCLSQSPSLSLSWPASSLLVTMWGLDERTSQDLLLRSFFFGLFLRKNWLVCSLILVVSSNMWSPLSLTSFLLSDRDDGICQAGSKYAG